jgi:RimJ/RimL family protein N-acetyltransferase
VFRTREADEAFARDDPFDVHGVATRWTVHEWFRGAGPGCLTGTRETAPMDPALGPPIAAPLADVETDRLALRRFAPTDVDALAVVFAKPEVWQFPFGRAFTRDETVAFLAAQVDQYQSCGLACWLATERATDRVVGYVGISVPTFYPEILPAVEVGWRFDPDVWGRGYAIEGARAALAQAFGPLGLDRVCSLPQADNVASVRVAERLGMHRDRTVTLPGDDRRGPVEVAEFWITADEAT